MRRGRRVLPTGSDSPSGKDRRVHVGGRRLGDHPAVAELQRATADLNDGHASVIGKITITAVVGWLLAMVEFLALIYCTGGFR